MIYVNLSLERSDLHGVICRESASRIHNLSSFPEYPIIIQQEDAVDLETKFIHFISTEKLDLYHTMEIKSNLFVTSPERTIIDLIINKGEEKFIEESVFKYVRKLHFRLAELQEVAIHYDAEKELFERLNKIIGQDYGITKEVISI